MENFKKINNLTGWIIFAIATTVYFLTLEPTASWWDCGEYIATAYKLQVGHPPGAPLFQLLGRFFSLFAFGNLQNVALMINIMSALSSSFTILFLFWTITMLAKKLFVNSEDSTLTNGQGWAVIGAGAVGALAYTFSDSFWFSAVEGEVYAMSSFFTAIVFWAILRWEEVADHRHGFRWILLIAYIMGLSIGVHLLNLLAIPAIVYVYYFKKYEFSRKGFVISGLISLLILSLIMYLIIPGIVQLAGKFELFFVNSIGLPFNSGTIIYFLLIIGLIVGGLYYTRKKGKVILNTSILAILFILIGYSSFFILVIRANANTPINENDPKDAISLLSYLNREQYGTWPLLSGQYYNSVEIGREDGNPVYMKDEKSGKYVIKDDRKGTVIVYDPKTTTIFPRMWSNTKPAHISLYKEYGKIKGKPVRITKRDGTSEVIYKPTFGENLRFFFTYQVSHMYLRYFMWNFAGRQDNIESQGGIEHGNWISGIPFIDNARLGNQSDLPASMQNPARAQFYFLPLILGLVGIFFQLRKSKKDSWVVFLMFFMTGAAIIIYLNQTPLQPRERDYAYAGSFYAFSIWIGLGVLALYEALSKRMSNNVMAAGIVSAVCLLAVPVVMAEQGWEGHDRSGKYAARDFARMYLESCEPNAILFTNGDNDTFPLWYVQEVEGIRTDVRVVNYMLSSGDWYVDQMFNKAYESDPLPLSIPRDVYIMGDMNYIPVYVKLDSRVELKETIDFIADKSRRTKAQIQSGEWINYLPTKSLKLTIDSTVVVNSGTVKPEDAGRIVDEIDWEVKQYGLVRNDILLLDLIASNNWERPIYFANPNAVAKVFNVDKYCHLEGVVYRLKPIPALNHNPKLGGVDPDRAYKTLMADDVRWGRLNEPDVVIDRESARTSGMMKQNYSLLARTLTDLGRYDSAVKVMDRGIFFFPPEKYPYDYGMLSWADNYYKAGAAEKGNEVVRKLLERYSDDLAYYGSLSNYFVKNYDNEIQQSLAVLQSLSQLTRRYKQDELADEIDTVFYAEIENFDIR
ncbi:MAG: DUF2723 domain-containing protein [Bacteroidales bacterium]|nr:DUF2723 domain-containing protein [Bacteroidales bacterium]MCF6341882.1 DUF2723 domain-containing protein [Bacteroidales bacterium]